MDKKNILSVKKLKKTYPAKTTKNIPALNDLNLSLIHI